MKKNEKKSYLALKCRESAQTNGLATFVAPKTLLVEHFTVRLELLHKINLHHVRGMQVL
jgi:hypothetical protein